MTRKDYVRLAEGLYLAQPVVVSHDTDKWQQWWKDVLVIASVLQIDNPRFNPTKFYKACGV